jgi:glycosyltransferase involved in cell wall biosynthesis
MGGLPETLREEETGLLLAPGDDAVWRDTLVTAADMPLERRWVMREAWVRFVRERFSTGRIVEDFIELLGALRD